MIITVPYGESSIEVEVPQKRVLAVASPNQISEVDFAQSIKKALKYPVDSPPLDDFLAPGSEVLFIVNDGTRPTPTAPILEYIYDKYDLENHNPQFMVATGTHRRPTREEFSFIFGKLLEKYRDRIHVHDGKKSQCKYVGKTKFGTKVYVNKKALEIDKWVVISSVEPHYLAGFTGGRKSILPGISAYRTIEQNHSLYAKPGSKLLSLKNNPVHLDMRETLSFIDNKIFALNSVLNKDHKVCYLQAGDIHRSFERATGMAKEVFVNPIPQKADIVVTAATHPMDVSLYQAQKALESGKLALKDGGIIILVSPCREGIGNPTFFDLLASSPDPNQIIDRIKKNYKLGYHKAAKLAGLARRAEIGAVTELNSESMEKINLKPWGNLQKAIDDALARKEGKIIFLLDGTVTVPGLSGS